MSANTQTPPFGLVKSWLLVISPVVVIGLGHVTAVWAQAEFGDLAWLPLTLVFWVAMIVVLTLAGGWSMFTARLKPGKGGWLWPLLAVVIGLAPMPLLILHWHVLASPWVWLPWLIFAAINPFLEESCWRGVLLDATSRWPAWLAVTYSSAVFAISHPLM